MARRSAETERKAADRRRIFKIYGFVLAEDVDSPAKNQPTSLLFNMLTQAKDVSPQAYKELWDCLFPIEALLVRENYQGTICMYPYQELL